MGESAYVIQTSTDAGHKQFCLSHQIVGLEVYATAPDLKYTLLPDIVVYYL